MQNCGFKGRESTNSEGKIGEVRKGKVGVGTEVGEVRG